MYMHMHHLLTSLFSRPHTNEMTIKKSAGQSNLPPPGTANANQNVSCRTRIEPERVLRTGALSTGRRFFLVAKT